MKIYFLKLHWQILFTKIDEEPHSLYYTYMHFFYKRYNQLLKEGKIDSADQILMITGKNLGINYKNIQFYQNKSKFYE